jgi:GNAT superfamily N-acetyltransferase
MDEKNWTVKTAGEADFERWMRFAAAVVEDFYGIDLPNDENYRGAILKNIRRGTAVYVERNGEIIGAMIYSPNRNHIGWLAVGRRERRRGVGPALVRYMLDRIPGREEYKVKPFIAGEPQSAASHPFYESLGFVPDRIDYEDMVNNANHPTQLFVRRREAPKNPRG